MKKFSWLLFAVFPIACSDSMQVLTPPDSSTTETGASDTGMMMMQDTSVPDTSTMDASTVDAIADAPADGPACDEDAGQVLCNNMCVNTTSFDNDPKNCGFCGHDCLGATCAKGLCAPQTLVTKRNNPLGIVVDGQSFYVIEYGDMQNVSNNGRLFKCATGGCPNNTPSILSSALHNPSAITLDAANVYWANAGDLAMKNGTIMLCPVAGCGSNNANRKTLATVQFPHGIAVDATTVYFSNWGPSPFINSEIDSCAIAGCNGNPSVFGTSSKTFAVATDGTDVFFSNTSMVSNIYSRPANKSKQQQTLETKPGGAPLSISVNKTDIFWVDNNNFSVRMCPKAACNMNSVPLATNLNSPVAVTSDDTNVYWADQGSNLDGDIQFCTKPCPGGKGITLAKGQDGPSAIAIDSNYVYWTNQGLGGDNTGTVMRVAR